MDSVEDFTTTLEAALTAAFGGPGMTYRIVLERLEWAERDSMETLVLDIVYRDLSDGQTHRDRVADLSGLLASLDGSVDSLAGLLADDCYEQVAALPD